MRKTLHAQYAHIKLPFCYSMDIDFNSGKIRADGVKFYATKETQVQQGGCLFIHPNGAVQWVGNSFVEID